MAAASVCLTPTEEKTDCFRLLSLVMDGGTLVLRYRFDKAIPPNDLHNKLNDVNIRGKLNNLFTKKILKQAQWNVLYPTIGLPSSTKFDISLLSCLLRYICGLDESANAWNCVPPSFDHSVEADVTRLRLRRNEISHMESVSLTKQDFQTKWNEIEQVILRLGAGIADLYQDIQNLKHNSVDPVKEKTYRDIIKEWEKMDTSMRPEIVEIKTELSECVDNVNEHKDNLNQTHKQCLQNMVEIQTLEQHQLSNSSSIKLIQQDLLAQKDKIDCIETKQKHLEEYGQNSRETLDETQTVIYKRLDAADVKTTSIATSVQLLKSTEVPRVSSDMKHLSSIAKLHLREFALDEVYVDTHLHTQAKETLKKTRCVILSGPPGEGKTSMAKKIICEMKKSDTCLKLQEPSDWKHVDCSNTQFDTVFIDDIFGAGALDETLLKRWSRLLPDIEKAVETKTLYVIITTRHYILKEAKEKMKYLNLFSDENIQQLASFNLSSSERAEILEAHLKHAQKEIRPGLVDECNAKYEHTFANAQYDIPVRYGGDFPRENGRYIKAMIGFPEITSLFSNHQHLFEMGPSFFEQPLLFFKNCMDELILNREKFLALILIWTRQGYSLNIKDLEPPDISTEIEETSKRFGFKLKEKRVVALRDSLKYHEGGFLRFDRTTGNHTFCHNIVKEMVGLVVGQKYTNAVLVFANEEFLMQYVTTNTEKKDAFHIFIDEFRFQNLNTAVCKTFTTICTHVNETNIPETQPKFVNESYSTEELLKLISGALANMSNLTVTGSYTPLRDLPMSLGDDEINVSILQHDCFNNPVFVNTFLQSREGKDTLLKPVITFRKQFGYYGINLGRKDFSVYLPTRSLLEGNSMLLKAFIKQGQHRYIENPSDFLYISLLVAVHQKMKDVVEVLSMQGTSITDDAVLISAERNDIDMLCFLLRNPQYHKTAQSHIINKNSPLISAAKRGIVPAVTCLLHHGVDINYRNKNNKSALDKAILHNKPEVCKVLLENGSNVNLRTGKFKRTPLHTAADTGNKHISELLLKHGASIRIKDYRGHYPIHCAAIRGNKDIVKIFLKADMSQTTMKITSYGTESVIKGMDLFHIAVWKNDVEILNTLLKFNANPDIRDYYGRTPIYCAVFKTLNDGYRNELEKRRNHEIIDGLLKVANVNLADRNGYTPLHAAIHRGNTDIAKQICTLANVNAKDRYGKTPLHTACEKENLELVKLLVQTYHADVRMLTDKGQSIMHILMGRILCKEGPAIGPRLIKTMPRHVLVRAEHFLKQSHNQTWNDFVHIIEGKDPEFAQNWIDFQCRFSCVK
ncbi:uncharacterized protein LOC123527673 [Mercenaria mercenaria]|uniref:uncharacterized protein LOC123527673 n=1 Tax=Mercenaria mercenaria TaxID=6596 RepID=UPI00234F0F35|nr:uncharacterized protein LOC123527673 [Mercenaria mercenaria]